MKRYYTTATDGNVFEHPDGPFVLWAEHEAEVAAVREAQGRMSATIAKFDFDICPRLEARIAELEADRDGLIADLKDSRAIAAEQEDAHVAANMRCSNREALIDAANKRIDELETLLRWILTERVNAPMVDERIIDALARRPHDMNAGAHVDEPYEPYEPYDDDFGDYIECWQCGGKGYSHHDCGEDTCCCLYPEDNVVCDICYGKGGWPRPTPPAAGPEHG